MNHQAGDRASGVPDIGAVLWRRKWTILITFLVMLSAGLALSLRQTLVYEARSRILFRPQAFGEDAATSVQTESEVVASLSVARLVRADLGLATSAQSLLEELTVLPTVNAQVATLSYESPDPALAAGIVNSFAQSYIDHRTAQAIATVSDERDALEDSITSVQEELAALAGDIETARDDDEKERIATLEAQESALIARLSILEQRLGEVPEPSLNFAAGETLELASVPSRPSSPSHLTNGLLAGLLGLLIGLGLAFLRERFSDRLMSSAAVERQLAAPVLASVPEYKVPDAPDTVVAASLPSSPAAEAYRGLATSLRFAAKRGGAQSVLVASPLAGDGKSLVTANLGVALAQAGSAVALVSADVRRPMLETYLGLERGPGLTDWCQRMASAPKVGQGRAGRRRAQTRSDPQIGDAALMKMLMTTSTPDLLVLSSGSASIPGGVAHSPAIESLVEALESNFDYVLWDSPPALLTADTSILASCVRSAIVVLSRRSASGSAVLSTRHHLDRVGTNVLGVVLNRLKKSSAGYGTYYGKEYGKGELGAQEPFHQWT